jgi:osmotically inducible protein OsmC
MKRKATAVWKGSGKEGTGVLTTDSNTLDNTQYSFTSRFESGTGTNPEELIAAAHAGCFCMKLSFVVGNSDFTPDSLSATCTVTMDDGTITGSHIELNAQIPGIDAGLFAESVKDAEENCPISAVLSCPITVSYKLNE